jgi:hypothetical protein
MAEVQALPRSWQARRASSRVSAAIVDASTERLFGFANAVFDVVLVQRQPFGGHRVPACAGKTSAACGGTERAIRHRMQDQQASPSPVRSETLPSRRRLGRVRREPLENVLECRLAHLQCVGEQLSQLLDLHLGGQVLFGAARRLLFGCSCCRVLTSWRSLCARLHRHARPAHPVRPAARRRPRRPRNRWHRMRPARPNRRPWPPLWRLAARPFSRSLP